MGAFVEYLENHVADSNPLVNILEKHKREVYTI
jgi:hypothetical protein